MKRYLLCVAACLILAGCASEADSDLENIPCGDTICAKGLFCCNNTCVDLENSLEYCGNCTNSCPLVSNPDMHVTQSVCMNRQCTYLCESGFMDMDFIASNGCESSLSGCGNHKLDEGEVCDSEVLNGWTCSLQLGVEATGLPKCNRSCSGFEIGTCVAVSNNNPSNLCGNEQLDEREPCDGERLNGQTCASVVGEGSFGRLKCKSDCSGFDISGCSDISGGNTCGNTSIDTGENCDGNLLNGQTCATVKGAGYTGTLLCKSDCSDFDTSNCYEKCVPDDMKCEGLSLQVCNNSGQWVETQVCESFCDVDNGGCLSTCTKNNDILCSNNTLLTCNNNVWELRQACTDGYACDEISKSCQISCQHDTRRCEDNHLFICHDNDIGEDEIVCDGTCINDAGCSICNINSDCLSNRCNSMTHQCEVASTAKLYKSDFEWMKSMIQSSTRTSYTTEYIQPNTKDYVLKVHGRADIITEIIDGQAVMLNNNANSYIEISGLTGGVNIVVFDVVGYDNTIVSVTAGMTQTSSVFKNEIKTMAFTFNNNADKILIQANNRVTIDNLAWTSMK